MKKYKVIYIDIPINFIFIEVMAKSFADLIMVLKNKGISDEQIRRIDLL